MCILSLRIKIWNLQISSCHLIYWLALCKLSNNDVDLVLSAINEVIYDNIQSILKCVFSSEIDISATSFTNISTASNVEEKKKMEPIFHGMNVPSGISPYLHEIIIQIMTK